MGNRRRWPTDEWVEFLESRPGFSLVYANHRAQVFVVHLGQRKLQYPFALLDPKPRRWDRFDHYYVDETLGSTAVWYVLQSGKQGLLTAEEVLNYYREPSDVRTRMLCELTYAALEHISSTGFSRSQILKRLHTSPSQLQRILDPSPTTSAINLM